MAVLISRRSDWASAEGWNGKLEGLVNGTCVYFLFNEVSEAGKGPPLYKHPYDEIYIVRRGQARITFGDSEDDVTAGDILVVPAGTPHKVLTLGSGPAEITSVHASGKFEAEFLE